MFQSVHASSPVYKTLLPVISRLSLGLVSCFRLCPSPCNRNVWSSWQHPILPSPPCSTRRFVRLYSRRRWTLARVLCTLGRLVPCVPGGQRLRCQGYPSYPGPSGPRHQFCGRRGLSHACSLLFLVAALALCPGVPSVWYLPANHWTVPLSWLCVLTAPPLLQRRFRVLLRLPCIWCQTPPFVPDWGSCGRPSCSLRLGTALQLVLSIIRFKSVRPPCWSSRSRSSFLSSCPLLGCSLSRGVVLQ